MGNWLEKLIGDTRGRLLALLRRSRQTVSELARVVGISDNAVRGHLAALERDGMVAEAGVRRSTGGKPAQEYDLTREAEELFPKAYAFVLGELIRVLEHERGPDGAAAMMREVGRRAAAACADAGGDLEGRVEAAAAMLRSLGGDVEVKRTDSGWRLQGYGCPLSGVVADHPEACALAQALVEEITGRRVAECCEREGRPRCGFEAPAGSSRERPARKRKS